MNNQTNNNMNFIPNMNMIGDMNNNINLNPNIIPNMNNNMIMMQQQMMQQQMMQQQMMQQQMMQQMMQQQLMQQQMMQQQMMEEERKKEEIKKIKNYFDSKLYEIDLKKIKDQNKSFKKMKDKLMSYVKTLEKSIEYNDKIINSYLGDPNNKINYQNLLKLGSSIEYIYKDKMKEFELYKNEIRIIHKQAIEELINKNLIDFNKKYNLDIRDESYVSFRNFPELNKLDEIKFKELCSINSKYIKELELKFEDNIDINLTNATYII